MNQSQLPPGMEHCTILFRKCPRGHGRLLATNWIDNGCMTCALDSAELALRKAQDELDEVRAAADSAVQK